MKCPAIVILETEIAADGDLMGNYPAPIVAGLRNRPIAAVAPDANDVLIFDGTDWRPGPLPPTGTRFVQLAAPPAGDYAIVAAGRFDVANGSPLLPVYNNLQARRISPPNQPGRVEFALTFDGYRAPQARPGYIVKGTTEGRRDALFQVVSFGPSGFTVRVRTLQGDDRRPRLRFMVEVSQILR